MDRRQLAITITAIALAVVLGVGVTLLATSGGDDEQTIESDRSSTTSSAAPVSTSTTATTAAGPSTQPPVTPTTITPGTVVIVPDPTTTTGPPRPPRTQPPTTAAPTTTAPTTTTPPTAAPQATTTTAPATTTTAPTTTTTEPSGRTDIGVTADRIRLAVIADDTDVLDGARAWAGSVNRRGGIGGRKIRLDLLPTNGSAEGYAAAVATACERAFAIVAGFSAFDADTTPLGCGIPDLPIETTSSAHAEHPSTYPAFPRRAGVAAVGPYRYLQSTVDGCCTQYVLVPDREPERSRTQATIDAAVEIGFETVATPEVAFGAPPEEYDAIAQDLIASEADFAASGVGLESTVQLRGAAGRAGVDTVKAWYCDARCYDERLIDDGGLAVEDQYVAIDTVPFSDRSAVPALRTYLRATDRAGSDADYDGLRAYIAGLLFEQAIDQVVADHGSDGVTRLHLLESLAGIDAFTADGLVGQTDVAAQIPNGCTVVLQVHDARFARAHPAERGSLDCEGQNLVQIET